MKMNTFPKLAGVIFCLLCLFPLSGSMTSFVFSQSPDTPKIASSSGIVIPGDVDRLCYSSGFFYNFPSEDFLHYLNDRMLFWEKPDEVVMIKGIRYRMLEILKWHRSIKDFIANNAKLTDKKNMITLKLADPQEYKKAVHLMLLLGYHLKKNSKGQFYLKRLYPVGIANYLQFSLVKSQTLEQQFNNTGFLHYYIKESIVPLPGSLSLSLLEKISEIQLDKDNFLEHMLGNERLSVLMAVLLRMTEKEIRYIDGLKTATDSGAWKTIYNDKKMLMGLYVLSNAFRVIPRSDDNLEELHIPGGSAARQFWAYLATEDKSTPKLPITSFQFLENLCTLDKGKLAYVYVFSYYLQEKVRRSLFFDYDPLKFQSIYHSISLKESEMISESMFPQLGDWNFFTLMYSLKLKNGELYFPLGVKAWLAATKGKTPSQESQPTANTPNLTDATAPGNHQESQSALYKLLNTLLDGSGSEDKIRTFMAVYSKLSQRPEILTEDNLTTLYKKYDKYNAVLDYIEKIPLKKPETVSLFLDRVHQLENLGKKDQELFTVLYQSLLELLAFTAKYKPEAYDYDFLLSELFKLPLDRGKFYRQLFRFFENRLGVDRRGESIADVILRSIPAPIVKLGSDSTDYRFNIRRKFRKTIDHILEAQETCSFSDLLHLNRLLKESLNMQIKKNSDAAKELAEEITDAATILPHAGISGDAPRKIRARVISYSQSKFDREIKNYVGKILSGDPLKSREEALENLQGDFLLFQLKVHLLTLAYAVNAKNNDINAFLNPNFVRFHDIASGRTYWDNSRNESKSAAEKLFNYHLRGPLSRLNMGFASRWKSHLFRANVLHNKNQVKAVITNLLPLYPLPMVDKSATYTALLVDLGLEVLRTSKENPDNEFQRHVALALATQTGGYHYRKGTEYSKGGGNHSLFFNELKKIGEYFWKLRDKPFMTNISAASKLKVFMTPDVTKKVQEENHWFGSIYTHTFGNLNLYQYPVFPQETANLLASGWFSGGMIDEFKIKLAYHMHKKNTSPYLIGQCMLMYLNTTARRFLRQNHVNDYPVTYFIFDIFNNAHLKRLIKKMKKEGILNLK
jgi:hypothetical protein